MNITMIVDTLWVLLAAVLVFFMNLGFAAVESGMARAKIQSISCRRILLFLPSHRLALCLSAGD